MAGHFISFKDPVRTRHLQSSAICPTGYIDSTKGNAYWWSCAAGCPEDQAWVDANCKCACVAKAFELEEPVFNNSANIRTTTRTSTITFFTAQGGSTSIESFVALSATSEPEALKPSSSDEQNQTLIIALSISALALLVGLVALLTFGPFYKKDASLKRPRIDRHSKHIFSSKVELFSTPKPPCVDMMTIEAPPPKLCWQMELEDAPTEA